MQVTSERNTPEKIEWTTQRQLVWFPVVVAGVADAADVVGFFFFGKEEGYQ